MESGGFDANFVEEPSDHLKCVICHLALRNPVLFVDCGHSVCQTCFNQLQKHCTQTGAQLLCPHDRLEIDGAKVVENKGISRIVLDLQVACDNSLKGCGWVGELRDLHNHVQIDCKIRKDIDMMSRLECLENAVKKVEQEKEKEIAELKNELRKKDEEIENLKGYVEQRFDALEKEVELLSNNREGSVKRQETEQTPCKELKVFNLNEDLKERIGVLEKHYKSFNPVQVENFGTIKSDLRIDLSNLQNVFMNVDEYVPNVRTVFKWRIANYCRLRDEDDVLFSPKFYSRPKGHCCMLSVCWHGKNKGRFQLFFRICKGKFDEVIDEDFNMEITFKSTDRGGNTVTDKVTIDEVRDNYEAFTIDEEDDEYEDTSDGFGHDSFLNMPVLNRHVIDDVLIIKCILSYPGV